MDINQSESLESVSLESETIVIENEEAQSPAPAQPEPEAAAADPRENEALLKEILERIKKIDIEIATFRQATEENWNCASKMNVAYIIFGLGSFFGSVSE